MGSRCDCGRPLPCEVFTRLAVELQRAQAADALRSTEQTRRLLHDARRAVEVHGGQWRARAARRRAGR
jgi:hypothetical protein